MSHIEAADFSVAVHHPSDLNKLKDDKGILPRYQSCHTAINQEGYVFEGHIPADVIKRFLSNPPANALGLAVPGMPVGSPGMEMGDRYDEYDVLLLGRMAAALFLSTLLKSSHPQLIQFERYEMKYNKQDIRLVNSRPMSRRRFVTGIAAGSAFVGLGLGAGLSMASASNRLGPTTLKGNKVDLNIAYEPVNFTGKNRMATAINGSGAWPHTALARR